MKMQKLLPVMLLIAGCASNNGFSTADYIDVCPQINIRHEDRAIIQKVGAEDIFKIEVTGWKGRCYYDERVKKDKAVVAPEFKITRLSPTNIEDVHFSYYMETAQGPERFLGKKTYFAKVEMLKDANEIYYTATENELAIPAGKYDFDMYIGLNAVKADSEYKLK